MIVIINRRALWHRRTATVAAPHGMPHYYCLVNGNLLTLELWAMADTQRLVVDDDGWTLRSATGGRAAYSAHTIAITEDGAEVLTHGTHRCPWTSRRAVL